ncbi:MAG TPA: hypothetical protein VFZ34_33275 [Blastocatellia bacterium]|nr:hypothetical protein [Blastocatellia bacterium]
MKQVRLVKKETIQKPVSTATNSAPQSAGLKQAMKVVREWVQVHHTTPQPQARQVFASLFTQPQS